MANLDSSYRWLQRKVFTFPYTLGLIVSQMHQAAQESKRSLANDYAIEAIQFADRLGIPLERSVVRLECAIAYSKVNPPGHPADLLREGVKILLPYVEKSKNNKHYFAVANWLLGCIFVELPQQRLEVIYTWNTSMEAFGSLIYHPHNITGDKEWYLNRHREMGVEIKNFVIKESISPPKDTTQPIPLPADWPMAELYSGGLQLLEVVGEIPAGGFGPAGMDSFATERITLKPEMKIFRLSGAYHRMYNLRGQDMVVRLNPSGRYFLLQVTGDSMNRANIMAGDYVLIRRQETAKDGDIIMAGIRSEEDLATLKRYREQNGKVILQPESTNEEWKPREFSRQDLLAAGNAWRLRIHGVALAVFKPSRKPGP